MGKQDLITIKDILDESQTVEKGKYRNLFEAKKETKKSVELESIVNSNLPSIAGKVYKNAISSSDSGKRFGIATIDISVDEYRGQHGLTYKTAYQVVDLKSKKIIGNFGPVTYRGGHASDRDNWSIYFTESKVLEEKKGFLKEDSVVVGLKSKKKLEILEFKENGQVEDLESYNLDSEEKQKSKSKNINKAIKELDKNAIERLIESKYSQGVSHARVIKTTDDASLVRISYYDRNYDAKINSVSLCLVLKDKGLIELGKTHLNTHHPNESKFYTVRAKPKDLELKYSKEKIDISGKFEAWYTPANNFGGPRRLQDTKEFSYKIDLSKL